MKTTTLKKLIKQKFGSQAKFAKLIKIDRYDLQKFFAAAEKKMTPEREVQLEEYARLVKVTKNNSVESDMTPELRERITKAIEEQFGGVSKLCVEHPEFNAFSVWQLLNGRRKTISATVRKLIKLLKIDERIL